MLVSTEEIAKFWYEMLETCPEIADMGICLKMEDEDTVEIDGVWQTVYPEHRYWWTRDNRRLSRDQPWPGGQPWPLPPTGLAANVATLAEMERRDAAVRAAAKLTEVLYVHLVLLQKPVRILAKLSIILDSEARVKLNLKLVVLPELRQPLCHQLPTLAPPDPPPHPYRTPLLLTRPPVPAFKHWRRLSRPIRLLLRFRPRFLRYQLLLEKSCPLPLHPTPTPPLSFPRYR